MRIGDFAIDDTVRSQVNTLILGSIGFGKSSFLEECMRQDLADEQPHCFIGLHSQSYHNMVRYLADNNYVDRRIILIDPSEGEWGKGINPFRQIPGIQQSVQVGGMVEAVMSVMGDNPNTHTVIFRLLTVIFTAMLEYDLTLDAAFELFANRTAFSRKVETLCEPTVKALWSSLSKIPPSSWETQVAPTTTRLFRIIRSDTIRRFMCVNHKGYNLELTFKDYIYINLGTSGNLDSDAQRVSAALALNHFYQRAKLRRGKEGEPPPPYYLYVDEWWLVPSPDFHRILAETRKFGLLLVLANQDLAQIRDCFSAGFAESLLTLCQLQICFGGINNNDASRLAREWGLPVEQFKNIVPRQFLAKPPRGQAGVYTMPEVSQSYLAEQVIKTFERKIARKRGALLLEDVDRLRARLQSEGTIDEGRRGEALKKTGGFELE